MSLYRNSGQESSSKKKLTNQSHYWTRFSRRKAWGLEVGDGTLGSSSNFRVWKFVPSHFDFFLLMVFIESGHFLGKWCWPDTIITASPKNWLD